MFSSTRHGSVLLFLLTVAFALVLIALLFNPFVQAAPRGLVGSTPTSVIELPLIYRGFIALTPSPTPTGPLPDLTITYMKIELETGNSCQYNSTVLGARAWFKNIGTADAGPFVVDVNGAQQTVTNGLTAGQETSLWFPISFYGSPVTAVVDSLN